MNIIKNAIEKVSQSFPSVYSKDDVISLLTGIDIEVKKEVDSEIVDGIVKQIEENKHLILNDGNCNIIFSKNEFIKQIQCEMIAEIMPKLKSRLDDAFDSIDMDDIFSDITFEIRYSNEVDIKNYSFDRHKLTGSAMEELVQVLDSEFGIEYNVNSHMIVPARVPINQ